MRAVASNSWVVYSMPLRHSPNPMRAVCEQSEWEKMNREKPDFYTLIQAGITNEGEAERLARGTSGEVPRRTTNRVIRQWPGESVSVVDGAEPTDASAPPT